MIRNHPFLVFIAVLTAIAVAACDGHGDGKAQASTASTGASNESSAVTAVTPSPENFAMAPATLVRDTASVVGQRIDRVTFIDCHNHSIQIQSKDSVEPGGSCNVAYSEEGREAQGALARNGPRGAVVTAVAMQGNVALASYVSKSGKGQILLKRVGPGQWSAAVAPQMLSPGMLIMNGVSPKVLGTLEHSVGAQLQTATP